MDGLGSVGGLVCSDLRRRTSSLLDQRDHHGGLCRCVCILLYKKAVRVALDTLDTGGTDCIHIHHWSQAETLLYAWCPRNHLPASMTPDRIFDLQHKTLAILVAQQHMSICHIICLLYVLFNYDSIYSCIQYTEVSLTTYSLLSPKLSPVS